MWWLSKTMVARRQTVAGMVHASLQRNVQTKAAELWEIAQLDLVSVVSSYFRPPAISVKIALIFRTLLIPLLMVTQHLWLIPSENVAMVSNLQMIITFKKMYLTFFPDVCFVRLDFDTFTIQGPAATNEPTDGHNCVDSFVVTGTSGLSSPVICGINTGQHGILYSITIWQFYSGYFSFCSVHGYGTGC